ncbi:hypothetical protein C8R44DRAFT_735832 [Mycena epipterygia]|nr:hypothetical protein C8R44DRAFT_735832 [Mycena epipterygia]
MFAKAQDLYRESREIVETKRFEGVNAKLQREASQVIEDGIDRTKSVRQESRQKHKRTPEYRPIEQTTTVRETTPVNVDPQLFIFAADTISGAEIVMVAKTLPANIFQTAALIVDSLECTSVEITLNTGSVSVGPLGLGESVGRFLRSADPAGTQIALQAGIARWYKMTIEAWYLRDERSGEILAELYEEIWHVQRSTSGMVGNPGSIQRSDLRDSEVKDCRAEDVMAKTWMRNSGNTCCWITLEKVLVKRERRGKIPVLQRRWCLHHTILLICHTFVAEGVLKRHRRIVGAEPTRTRSPINSHSYCAKIPKNTSALAAQMNQRAPSSMPLFQGPSDSHPTGSGFVVGGMPNAPSPRFNASFAVADQQRKEIR